MTNNQKIKTRRGFTLIELLVVISIIGLLSSVVLAALSGARDKGRVGAGQLFADNNYHAIGDQQFFWYKFDNASNLGLDSSGNNFQATLSGSPLQDPVLSYNGSKALKLNGTSQYLVNPSDIVFQTGSTGITISVWVKIPVGTTGYRPILVNSPSDQNYSLILGLGIYSADLNSPHPENDCKVSVSFAWNAGGDGHTNLCDNKWHNVTATVNIFGNWAGALYVDGKKEASLVNMNGYGPYTLPYTITGGVVVGNDDGTFVGTGYFSGDIDDPMMFKSYLSLSQVQKMYAEGLKTHQVAEK